MKRKDLYLTELQIKKLEQIKETTGISVAETVRRALDEYFKQFSFPLGDSNESSDEGNRAEIRSKEIFHRKVV